MRGIGGARDIPFSYLLAAQPRSRRPDTITSTHVPRPESPRSPYHAKTKMIRPQPLLLLALLAACGERPLRDYGEVCFDHDLTVVASSQDCSTDHKGIAYSCTATLDGTTVTATTLYTPGEDPNDRCAAPIIAPCGLTLIEGDYTFIFGGDEMAVDVQADAAICVPSGGAYDTGT